MDVCILNRKAVVKGEPVAGQGGRRRLRKNVLHLRSFLPATSSVPFVPLLNNSRTKRSLKRGAGNGGRKTRRGKPLSGVDRSVRGVRAQGWHDVPPGAVAIEPAEGQDMTVRQARRYVEAFNRAALGGARKVWAVALPVRIRYEGDPRPGEPLRAGSACA